MGFLDQSFVFSGAAGTPPAADTPQSLSGTAAQNSTNVYDKGSAMKLFGGSAGRGPKWIVAVSAVGGTSPTFEAKLVGADDAALTSNVEVIAHIGPTRVLTAADLPFQKEVMIGGQVDSKRYYGVIYVQGGTSPTASVLSYIAMDAQSSGQMSGGAQPQP